LRHREFVFAAECQLQSEPAAHPARRHCISRKIHNFLSYQSIARPIAIYVGTTPRRGSAAARAFPVYAESDFGFQVGFILIQDSCWFGGQQEWGDLFLTIFDSGLAIKARCASSIALRWPPIWPGATDPVAR
jgi:hypothetical protein